jgi:lactoylglutathione lyase
MKFAKTIVYVEDAKASLEFFEKAFGLKTRAYYDQGVGEVETGGGTTIAFANYGIGQGLPDGTFVDLASPVAY